MRLLKHVDIKPCKRAVCPLLMEIQKRKQYEMDMSTHSMDTRAMAWGGFTYEVPFAIDSSYELDI